MNFFLYISFYFFLLFSIIGHGNLFQQIFFRGQKINLGYLGFFGIFILLIISYIFNVFVPLSSKLNFVILFTGFIFFIKFLHQNYLKNKIDLFLLLIIFGLLIVFILTAKNHDDFSYYHFEYIHFITKFPSTFGIGIFNHGFRTHSSIFYLSSLFYLPKVEYNLIHIAPVFFLGFANFIFIKKIYTNLKNKEGIYIILLSLLSLVLANVFFYRMAEHGTDRSAQIVILIVVIEILQFINRSNFDRILLSKIIVLITITISLKAFYVMYLLLILPVVYYQNDKFQLFLEIFKNKIFYICLVLFLLFISVNFLNTGCVIYPVQITCNENLLWAIPLEQVVSMNDWYELWSKGGATPNFRVENPDLYIQNFNWVSNWLNVYFFNKVSDFLLGLIFSIFIFYIFLVNWKKIKTKLIKRKYLALYLTLLFLFFEWFYNHPALRYGGYHLIALLIFLPVAFAIEKKIIINKKLIKKINFLIIIIALIFLSRNILRINKEIEVYNYDFYNNASYNKSFQNYSIYKNILDIKKCNLDIKKCPKQTVLTFEKYNKDGFYIKK
jgi:hypothetical protein